MTRGISLTGVIPKPKPEPLDGSRAILPLPTTVYVPYGPGTTPIRAVDVPLQINEAVGFGDDGIMLGVGRITEAMMSPSLTVRLVCSRAGWLTHVRLRLSPSPSIAETVVIEVGRHPVNQGEWTSFQVSSLQLHRARRG